MIWFSDDMFTAFAKQNHESLLIEILLLLYLRLLFFLFLLPPTLVTGW